MGVQVSNFSLSKIYGLGQRLTIPKEASTLAFETQDLGRGWISQAKKIKVETLICSKAVVMGIHTRQDEFFQIDGLLCFPAILRIASCIAARKRARAM